MCTWLVVYDNNVCVVTEAVSEDMYSVYNSYSVFLLKNRHFFGCPNQRNSYSVYLLKKHAKNACPKHAQL